MTITKKQEQKATSQFLTVLKQHPEGLTTAQLVKETKVRYSGSQVRRLLRKAGVRETLSIHQPQRYGNQLTWGKVKP